jgi:hypothetical protein
VRYDEIEVRNRPAADAQRVWQAPLTTPVPPQREIVVAGHPYAVRELPDPASQTPTLVFTGENVARRVRRYPANWHELTDEALAELSWSR